MNDTTGMGGGQGVRPAARTATDAGATTPDSAQESAARPGAAASERDPVPAWLDDAAEDFGAPQATVDALVMRLGFQPMARLIADRPGLRAAVVAEYRQQCAELRRRLLYEEWHA